VAVEYRSPGPHPGPAGGRELPIIYDDGAGRCYLIERGGARTPFGSGKVPQLLAVSEPYRRVSPDEPIEAEDLQLRKRLEVSADGVLERSELAFLRPLSASQAFGRDAA
jgi:hypothetical protein